jgi:two-component system nitrogen regulation sensor histidine kinase GlnL
MRGRVTFDRDESGGWTHFRIHLPVAEAGDLAATAAAA